MTTWFIVLYVHEWNRTAEMIKQQWTLVVQTLIYAYLKSFWKWNLKGLKLKGLLLLHQVPSIQPGEWMSPLNLHKSRFNQFSDRRDWCWQPCWPFPSFGSDPGVTWATSSCLSWEAWPLPHFASTWSPWPWQQPWPPTSSCSRWRCRWWWVAAAARNQDRLPWPPPGTATQKRMPTLSMMHDSVLTHLHDRRNPGRLGWLGNAGTEQVSQTTEDLDLIKKGALLFSVSLPKVMQDSHHLETAFHWMPSELGPKAQCHEFEALQNLTCWLFINGTFILLCTFSQTSQESHG